MVYNLNWRDDPIVRLEKSIQPASAAPATILLAAAGAAPHADTEAAFALMATAAETLGASGEGFLAPTGVRLDEDGKARCKAASATIAAIADELRACLADPRDQRRREAVAEAIDAELKPEVEAALDAFRRVFLTMVLERQARHAVLYERTVEQLERVSRQIFLVAINASIEAAKIGEKGDGVAYLGAEIRRLSQSAQSVIEEMRAKP